MHTSTDITAIVPMYNAAATIARCLAPLLAMLRRGELAEIIVVDDGSTDRSPEIVAAHAGVHLVRSRARAGPAAARNHAAQLARGTYLWFVDSDVVVADDGARVLAQTFAETEAGAVFGCYDDAPGALNFLSQYKNLAHRYYHRRGKVSASTFWAGCGAVERDLLGALGGFDARRYRCPSIEDIELGYRIVDSGRLIVLRDDLQGKHLKEWRLGTLLRTDIFQRAIPWSRLMFERRRLTDDLNVGVGERIRALFALVWMLALMVAATGLISPWLPAAALAAAALANSGLIRFFTAQRGAWFAARAFVFHQLYYLYSSAAFACAAAQHVMSGPRALRRSPERPGSSAH
jgi:glycosyltransferase involved in cell wall biosynthesis